MCWITMSEFAKLKQACQQFQASLDKLQVGVVPEDEKVSTEQDILNLKETNDFINSKIKTIKVSNTSSDDKDYENIDLKTEKEEFINGVINSQQTDTALHSILMGYVLESVQQNTSKEKVYEVYRQKLVEQLELLRNRSEQIKQLCERQEVVLSEISNVQHLIDKHNTFSSKLKEKTVQYNVECNESYSETDKKDMEIIKARVHKINFMRILIRRLLIYSDIDWKQRPDFKNMFKTEDIPVTFDSLIE